MDEQIIKTLECLLCGKEKVCKGCVNQRFKHMAITVDDFIALIQRQKSEIEKLTERLERDAKFQYDLCGQIVDLKEQLAAARAEIERLKAELEKRPPKLIITRLPEEGEQ